jgi:hypothetical protein
VGRHGWIRSDRNANKIVKRCCFNQGSRGWEATPRIKNLQKVQGRCEARGEMTENFEESTQREELVNNQDGNTSLVVGGNTLCQSLSFT